MESERYEQEELYRKLLMTVPDLIIRTDLAGTIVFINDFALKRYPFISKESVLGQNIFSFIAGEDLERSEANTRLMFDRQLGPQEYRLNIAGHYLLDTEVNGDVLRDAGNAPIGMVYVIRDISQRKRAETALQESEERYKNFFNQISEAVFRFEVIPPMPVSLTVEEQVDHLYDHSVLAECNPSLLEMYRVEDESQLIGRTLLDFHQGRNNPQNRETMRLFVKSGYQIRGLISEEPDSKGEIRIYRNNALGVVKNGFLVRSWSTQVDITEQRASEIERERLQVQLQQAQKMESVGRLAGGVAHDFNNMLGVILGYTDMSLGRIEPDHPLAGNLRQIRNAAERSANLTRQLLAFARKQTIAPRVLDLNATVSGMMHVLERLIGETAQLVWRPGEDLWPVRIDPSQVDQILANLCVNAREAISRDGCITIETKNSRLDTDYCSLHPEVVAGEYVCLVVSDNGCGMDREIQSHLFEPFYTTREQGKGTGLGLATVYGIVKQNDGFIFVYSEPGMGASFKIYFPAQRETAQVQLETEASVRFGETEGTILLVEDEPAILEMTGEMLRGFGYTVLSAASPDEAIDLARRHDGVDLLITDVVMPGMNGRDLSRTLLALYPGLKSLFMSGYTAEVIAQQGVLEKGVHFIHKPFSIDDLAARVAEALKGD